MATPASANEKDEIDLFSGWPNPTLLPALDLQDAATAVLSNPSVANHALLYGPDEGYGPLRTHIAQWLTEFYRPREPISHDRICITGGASQNLACILQVFTDPVYTRHVWMVAPTYHLACRTMDDAGFAGRLCAVPEDEEGIDIAHLEYRLREAEQTALRQFNTEPKMKSPRPWRKIYKHIIYMTPTFSNPSTKIMSLRRREELVKVARRYDALIVADDVYDFLQWNPTQDNEFVPPDRACVPRLVDVDRYLDGGPQDEWGHAMSNASFSKLIGPGMRTGWVEGTKQFAYGLSQVGSSRSGGAPSHLCAAFIDHLLHTGILQKHIRDVLLPKYAERYYLTMSAIGEYLVPRGVTVAAPSGMVAGGYFIWITLPSPLLARDVAEQALSEEMLRLAPGELFQVQGDAILGIANSIRLCFAWEEPRYLVEGVRRLARFLDRLTVHEAV